MKTKTKPENGTNRLKLHINDTLLISFIVKKFNLLPKNVRTKYTRMFREAQQTGEFMHNRAPNMLLLMLLGLCPEEFTLFVNHKTAAGIVSYSIPRHDVPRNADLLERYFFREVVPDCNYIPIPDAYFQIRPLAGKNRPKGESLLG